MKNTNTKIINDKSIKIRKQHPNRDWLGKKVGIPASAALIATGLAYGVILTIGVASGTGFLIPMTSSHVMNVLSTLSVSALGGLVLTPVVLKVKNALTLNHYNKKYNNIANIIKTYSKSLEKQLKKAKTQEARNEILKNNNVYQYVKEKSNKNIDKLTKLIEKDTNKILALRDGNFFTKPFRAMKRTRLNIINRNRVHHLAKYAEDLSSLYSEVKNNEDTSMLTKNLNLRNIYSPLENIDSFIKSQLNTSKKHFYASHAKKEMIENIDIYAKLQIKLNEEKVTRAMRKPRYVKNVAINMLRNEASILDSINDNIRGYLKESDDTYSLSPATNDEIEKNDNNSNDNLVSTNTYVTEEDEIVDDEDIVITNIDEFIKDDINNTDTDDIIEFTDEEKNNTKNKDNNVEYISLDDPIEEPKAEEKEEEPASSTEPTGLINQMTIKYVEQTDTRDLDTEDEALFAYNTFAENENQPVYKSVEETIDPTKPTNRMIRKIVTTDTREKDNEDVTMRAYNDFVEKNTNPLDKDPMSIIKFEDEIINIKGEEPKQSKKSTSDITKIKRMKTQTVISNGDEKITIKKKGKTDEQYQDEIFDAINNVTDGIML